jgi:hypothetical protein
VFPAGSTVVLGWAWCAACRIYSLGDQLRQ